MTLIDPLNCIHSLEIEFLKCKMVDGRHLEKPLNRHKSTTVQGSPWNLAWWRILTLLSL